jgi:hypothetical protein
VSLGSAEPSSPPELGSGDEAPSSEGAGVSPPWSSDASGSGLPLGSADSLGSTEALGSTDSVGDGDGVTVGVGDGLGPGVVDGSTDS